MPATAPRSNRRAGKKSASKGRTKYVYSFGAKTDGNRDLRNLLGGKGANLAEMCNLGLPVPPGFTISTEVCTWYYDHDESYPTSLSKEVEAALAAIERETGKRFGNTANPLLVSVRSGARVSMPGMMDTVLNLGLQRHDRRGACGEVRERALRVGRLPPLRADVRGTS